MSGLVTTITKVNATADGIADTEVNPVNVVGASRTITVTTVGAVSLDSALLRLPDGANRVFWTPGTEAQAGTVGALLELLLQYAVEIEGTADQVIVEADEDGNLTLRLPQSIATNSDVQFKDLIVRHLAGSSAKPVVVSFGTGAGSSTVPAAQAVNGDNLQFQLDLTASATPAGGNANLATFAFQVTYATPPRIFVVPMNRFTMALQGSTLTACAVAAVSETGFTFNVGTTALNPGTPYSWGFLVMGR